MVVIKLDPTKLSQLDCIHIEGESLSYSSYEASAHQFALLKQKSPC